MTRRKNARSKSRSSSIIKKFFKIIIGLFIVVFSITVILFAFFIIAKPKFNHKNIVFTPGRKSGGEGVIVLAEFYEKTNSIDIIRLQGDIKSNLIGGYGEYKLRAVNGILEIDGKGRGYKKSAISHFLGKGIDEIVEYESALSESQTKTSLMKFFMENKKTFFDSLLVKNVESKNINYFEINTKEEWDKHLKRQITWKINEECSVAVVNSTGVSGLATEFGKILENSGVEVIRSTNNIWGDSKTALFVDNLEECEEVKQRVRTISPIDLNQVLDTGKTSEYRANIVLFIGDEIAEVFED